MTDEKQIEEMAQDIYYAIQKECKLNAVGHCNNCEFDLNTKEIDCQSYLVAKILKQMNYRKLPPKAVVMTNEDYNRLFTRARQGGMKVLDFESIRKAEEKTRKETAREIITEIREFAERSLKIYGCIEEVDFEVLCNELAKKCGVEVEEL